MAFLLTIAYTWLTGTKKGTMLYKVWEELGVLGNDGIPRGGSREMAIRMQKKFEDLGDAVYTNTSVQKIEMANANRATGICACDTDFTFHQLLDECYMDRKMKEVYADRNAYPVYSLFHIAFAVEGEFDGVDNQMTFECKEMQK